MKIGIYNKWLYTCGGGEKYIGTMAEILGQHHQVDFLTHTPVASEELARRLDLDLEGCEVKVIPERSDYRTVIEASRQYDLFINASHLDYFSPRGRRNVLLVYFPARTVAAASATTAYNRLKESVLKSLNLALGQRGRRAIMQLVFAGRAGQSSDQTLVGQTLLALLKRFQSGTGQDELLRGYDLILAISEFTAGWIREYWNIEPFVLPPAVEVDRFRPLEKQNWIVSVGRFFAGSHNKKHLEMARAFQQMCSAGLEGWQLHMAGGYSETESNRLYLDSLQKEIKGYPISLHVNARYSDLIELYGKGAIFWHATGLGEDEIATPERFEHFGITTVEAMASGCVPVVIGKAGQLEIVRHGANGLLWQTLEDLQGQTRWLIERPEEQERLAQAAIRDGGAFGREAFGDRLDKAMRMLEP